MSKYTINGKEFTFPSSLKEITLQQRIDYDNLYGKELNAQATVIAQMPEDYDKGIEEFLHLADSACKSFSFFTGIDLDELKDQYQVRQVINVYVAHIRSLLVEETELDLLPEYDFMGEKWEIMPPAYDHTKANMSYAEFNIMKAVIKDMSALSDGNWDKLPSLCAYYLRKKGETIKDVKSQLQKRILLMHELPLDIAFTVGTYLAQTMSLYVKSLNSLKDEHTVSNAESGQ